MGQRSVLRSLTSSYQTAEAALWTSGNKAELAWLSPYREDWGRSSCWFLSVAFKGFSRTISFFLSSWCTLSSGEFFFESIPWLSICDFCISICIPLPPLFPYQAQVCQGICHLAHRAPLKHLLQCYRVCLLFLSHLLNSQAFNDRNLEISSAPLYK